MEPFALHDIWRVHEELRNIKNGQLECMETLKQHADRLARLESRGGDDKIRSLWGASSPFPALTPGGAFHTPTVPTLPREPTDDFDGFEVERGNNLLSSLPLDEIDVPRRGASRANSVRFDTSTLQNRWGQDIDGPHANSVHHSDYFGHRSNNNSIAGHPLTERSMSLKSDGRHSSMRSFDNSSFYGGDISNNMFPSPAPPTTARSVSTPGNPNEIAMPSMIRCWIETSFSLDTILYAAVCTGASKSTIDQDLVARFGLLEQVKDRDGENRIALSVYLPDAVTQQRPTSNASGGHFPRIVTEFVVIHGNNTNGSKLQLFLGCDILSASHADVLFSQRQVVLFVEDGRQMFVPFIQTQSCSEQFYDRVYTFHMTKKVEPPPRSETKDAIIETTPEEFGGYSIEETRKTDLTIDTAAIASPVNAKTDSQPHSPLSAATTSGQPNGSKAEATTAGAQGLEWRNAREPRNDDGNGSEEDTRNRSSRPDRPSVSTSFGGDRSNARSSSANPRSAKEGSNSGVWDSWRKQSTSSTTRETASRSGKPGSSSSGQGSQRGMKVLRASKASPAAAKKDLNDATNTEHNVSAPPSTGSLSRATSAMNIHEKAKGQRSVSSASGTSTLGHTKARSSANVVGGASAFHWMAGQQMAGQAQQKSTTSA